MTKRRQYIINRALGYVTRGTTALKVPQDLVALSLRSGRHSRPSELYVVEPRLTYPNLYLDRLYRIVRYALVMTNKVAREPAAGSDKNRLENRQPVWKGYN